MLRNFLTSNNKALRLSLYRYDVAFYYPTSWLQMVSLATVTIVGVSRSFPCMSFFTSLYAYTHVLAFFLCWSMNLILMIPLRSIIMLPLLLRCTRLWDPVDLNWKDLTDYCWIHTRSIQIKHTHSLVDHRRSNIPAHTMSDQGDPGTSITLRCTHWKPYRYDVAFHHATSWL